MSSIEKGALRLRVFAREISINQSNPCNAANKTVSFSCMEPLDPRLKDFIVAYCSKYKVHGINPNELHIDTSIDLDLDIVAIEIDLFLAEFTEQFNIDNSKFSWYRYGYPKGSARVRIIKTLFNYNRNWVKVLAGYCYKPKFKVQVLQEALQTGKLL